MTQMLRGVTHPGPVLKRFRVERGLTLAEVSKRCGLSVPALSKAENGKAELTTDKLLRISAALDVNISDVFGTPSHEFVKGPHPGRRSITRAGDGRKVKSRYGQFNYLAYDLLNKRAAPIIIDINARTLAEFGGFHRHSGEEFVMVLSGRLELHSDTYVPAILEVGDSMYFDSGMGHAYVAVDGPCQILCICLTSDFEILQISEVDDVADEEIEP